MEDLGEVFSWKDAFKKAQDSGFDMVSVVSLEEFKGVEHDFASVVKEFTFGREKVNLFEHFLECAPSLFPGSVKFRLLRKETMTKGRKYDQLVIVYLKEGEEF